MTAEEVIASLNNAWRALCHQYDKTRDETIRVAINKVAGLIGKVESEYREAQKKNEPHQITMEEWLEWLYSN